MTTVENALKYFVANYETLIAIWQGLMVALSTLCAIVGWTRASKIFGTVAVVDGGRLVRYARLALDARAAVAGLTKTIPLIAVLVLLGANQACSGSPPQLPPMVCPVPSQYLAALPTPAAVASSVQAAHGVVEHAKVVAEDPTVGAAVLVASRTLDSIEPLCPSLTEIAKVDCAARVAEARAVLAKEESTRQQICSAVKLAVFVAQVAEDTVPLVALDEVCR
jgi:hypothetical protein